MYTVPTRALNRNPVAESTVPSIKSELLFFGALNLHDSILLANNVSPSVVDRKKVEFGERIDMAKKLLIIQPQIILNAECVADLVAHIQGRHRTRSFFL
jgi:hypothetical protein